MITKSAHPHIRVHLDLRDALDKLGAVLESPAMTFGEDADGRHWENHHALTAQWHLEKNRETTIKRQAARLLGGYWPYKSPLGYVQKKIEGHGLVLHRKEPLASVLQAGLEGYAAGRFETQGEVARFFQSSPHFPKNRFGTVTIEATNRILTRLLYAGYLESPAKGIHMQKGFHESLISLETYNRIQDRLKGRAYVPARADISADFPLRGFVRCTCGRPFTASFSKSKTGDRHPYYMCFNKACDHYRKSIRRTDIEGAFEAILKGVQPTEKTYSYTYDLLRKAWEYFHAQAAANKEAIRRRIAELERQSETLLNRILDVTNASVMAKFEEKIAALESEKLATAEKLRENGQNHRPFDEMFELGMRFFLNPWKNWEKTRWNTREPS